MPQPKRNRFFASALAVTLGLAIIPVNAQAATSAELQAELDQVSQQMSSLYAAAEQAGYDLDNVTRDLNDTNDQITDLEGQISEEQEQLRQKQAQLSDILAAQYKMGDETGLLSLILSSGDFAELVSNIHYANKISEQKMDAIQDVRDLQESLENNKSQLEDRRTEQEQLVSDQQVKSDSANQAAAQAQAYYDQLSDEVKTKLAEEEAAARAKAEQEARAAAEAAAKKAEEEAAAAAAAASASSSSSSSSSSGSSSSSSSSGSNGSGSNGSSNGGGSNSGGSGGGSSNGGSSNKGGSSSSAASMVSRALSVVGSGYQWSGYVWTGSTSSSAFTCSGLIDYALGLPSNSSWPESLYSSVSYITTDVSSLNYGDLVFYTYAGRYPGHVGIYIGGGQIVDSCPGSGVQVRDINYPGTFIGGGPSV